MNNRVNYSLIGFLVLFSLSLMMAFGYWLLKPSKEIEMRMYAIYFNESVSGLNLDSPVKYRGIDVGKVTALNINPKNPEQIEVLVSILKSTPIKSSTVAQLTSQGITGLSYINLSFGNENAEPIIVQKGEKYPVIKTIPSLLIKIENTFGNVSINMVEILQRIQHLLKDENQENISLVLENSALLLSKMNQILDDKTILNFKQTIENLNNSSKKLDEMMPKITVLIEKSTKFEDNMALSLNSIMNSYLEVEDSMSTFKSALQSGEFNIKAITSEMVHNINGTLFEMQQLIVKTQEVIDKYERSPADAIFLQEEIKKGPGEE
ncbi:MlaD family protein [Sulfurimonas sp. CVO]|jgi:phospholipid/cholesterol/gamma-HCH transport system substrate-binding protein|uniref:MlaD family protein n=1 Tax=Sulfurimonas sp. CVO TaxID=2283483 RepID=UPI001F50829B|nr:MlaD family protein [Sulfurimonas sp. CVO]